MRETNLNLWDITLKSRVGDNFENIRRQMIPDDIIMAVK
jgi:hypothetical protein